MEQMKTNALDCMKETLNEFLNEWRTHTHKNKLLYTHITLREEYRITEYNE